MMVPFQATIIPAFRSPAVAVPRSLIDAARIDGLAEWRIPARRALRLHRISYGQVSPSQKHARSGRKCGCVDRARASFDWIRPFCESLAMISLRPNEPGQRTSDVFIGS